MTPDELKQRTKRFALRCLKVAEALPRSVTGKTVAGQLARCATSVAANYRAACRARSKADFVAKLGVVEEAADESAFWLELCVETGVLPASKLGELQAEIDELVRIIAASRMSARATAAPNRQSTIDNRK